MMLKCVLLFCSVLFICSCKEDAPTSLPGNEYVNEYMSLDPGESTVDNGPDLREYQNIWLPVFDGHYTTSIDYVKTKRSSQGSQKIRQTLIFNNDSKCSIRDVRDIKERAGYVMDEMRTDKFEQSSFIRVMYDNILQEDKNVSFSVREDGLYAQDRSGDDAYKEEKRRVYFKDDFQFKYCSQKGSVFTYEDLTYTTDNTETFTYTQTGNEILIVNEERQIKGVVSSDYKTISLTQISPNTQEIGTFNYK